MQDNPQLYALLNGVKSFGNHYNYCYCAYMAIRLIEMHRILKSSGNIYLHCDQTMSHYLKLIMDCIFGESKFRNEVIWCYHAGGATKKHFPRKHDSLLLYGKGNDATHNILRVPYRDFYALSDSTGRYNPAGKMMSDWWEISQISSVAKERTGYPTQKPLALLERIVQVSSNKGDLILDPFCGCATTCIAAEKLERSWIGIDVSQKAYELVKERLAKEVPEDFFRGEPHFTTTPPKRSYKDDDADGKKYVYIISNPKYPGEYKVGVARDTTRRLNSYQIGDPDRSYQLEYRLLTVKYNEVEQHIHRMFPNKHEWVLGELSKIKEAIKNYKE